ncbi:ATP synthase F1 subunit epsilon [Candidatus Gottesmanbacteria bacterium]|nr:ATP synthase F1 subunit epsilon [Candidatus Gottesmanbacteria bacterium]
MKFPLEIITPERQAFAQEVESVTVPTSRGSIGVLAHHVPLFSALTEGEVKITADNKEYFLAIGGGFMEVTPKSVIVLVSRAFHAEELNEAEIKKAQEAAKAVLHARAKGAEFSQAQAVLRRSILELKVLRRRKPSSVVTSRL